MDLRTLGGAEARLRPRSAQAIGKGGIRGRLDDAVELGAVRRHEAHAVDDDVVDLPPSVLPQEAVLEAGLVRACVGAPLRHDTRANDGKVAVDLLCRIDDLLAGVRLDLADVRALQESGEEADEL